MKTKTETLFRSAMFLLALLNYALQAFGMNPLLADETTVYYGLVVLFTIVIFVWSWWKNNSFTEAAKKADEYLEELRHGRE